jgi:hypothetical protein
VTHKIVELHDYSSAKDGSSMWAKVDTDGDGMANTEERVWQGSGEYYADINKDGYSETVRIDKDFDGRIDRVDTTGQGFSVNQVDASQVISPDSEHMVDTAPGEDNGAAAAREGEASLPASDTWQMDEGHDATSSFDVASADPGDTHYTDTGSSYDLSSSLYDSGRSYDSRGGSSDTETG